MKTLRVDDDVHEIITKLAQQDERTLTGYLNKHFRNEVKGKPVWSGPDIVGGQVAPIESRKTVPTPYKQTLIKQTPKTVTTPSLCDHFQQKGRCLVLGCKFS